MSEQDASATRGSGNREPERPGTVWRVTLAWPVTDPAGRQERVDGVQQLLSARSVVGLMGPGRPTRSGMVVDLVLPVLDTHILTAARDGIITPGPVGDDFAWELHRYTGAVVVNGDLAAGDFAVLASDGSKTDTELAVLLEEPIDAALLVGTVPTGSVEDVVDRLQVRGWLSDGARPVLAVSNPAADPSSLALPGTAGLSLGLRERPGRVDVLLWAEAPEAEAKPTRRRRAAARTPLLSTHLGARRRPIALPDFVNPEGSEVRSLLERLSEDFAPINAKDAAELGAVVEPARVDALIAAVNHAETLGLDPEAGVLAPEEDGLMPGQERPQAAEPVPHASLRAVLGALGEDPGWVGLFEGRAPVGRSARPTGHQVPAAAQAASEDPSANSDETERSSATHTSTDALPAPAQDGGGFASRVKQAGPDAGLSFDAILNGEAAAAEPAQVGPEATQAPAGTEATPVEEGIPAPTPAVGTPASSAGLDLGRVRPRAWPLVLMILGIVVLVAAGLGAWYSSTLETLFGTGYVISGAVAVVGLGLLIMGLTNRRR